ncbi:MAG TPA: DUF4870 domain-containing protein [Terriglobales bacterium]|nr:DUF4870 domain-containing protein [Terriglobales bacterium]
MAFCPSCGSQLAEGATVCPRCGQNTAQAPNPGTSTTGSAGGLTDNVAGMLAYITIIPAIIFLVLEPYNRNRFIRFHSWQNIFFHIAWIVICVALGVISSIPVLGWITVLLWPVVGLAGLAIWIVLLLKAYQGQMFKLPVIGDLAEKQAGA